MQRQVNVMLASLLIVAFASSAFATTHTINQTGITFSPADLTIVVGDEVQWVWSNGSHTVTSGTGPSDPNVGNLFDDPLNTGATMVSYTFTMAGDYPYFCRPHFDFDMTGVVHVEPTVSTESVTWGQIKVLFQ